MSNATIRVTFKDSAAAAGAHLSAEIDDRPAGFNEGKTGFMGGDSVFFLVHMSPEVSIVSADCSAGGVSLHLPSALITRTEDLQFEDEDSATLQIPATAIRSAKWLGRDLGAVSLQSDKQTIKAAARGVAVLRITYEATPAVYRLDSPVTVAGESDFDILVMLVGEVSSES